jgi:predicted metal-dependent phosphoesterase TrpH
VIDLHLHTTASDGKSSPDELVDQAAAAGLTTIAVTDHDTMAAVDAVEVAARRQNLTVVPGIEITAVHGSRDVHVLAYFLDRTHDELSAFLTEQRADRRRRFLQMLDTIDRLGFAVDQQQLRRLADEQRGRALARPLLADALVRAGHFASRSDAFDRLLGEGRPAFVPRRGASPRDVIDLVRRAGGVSSLAHPGKLDDDVVVAQVIEAGLPALEVHHPDHDRDAERRYRKMADEAGLLVTGGSDFHGPGSGRTSGLGQVGVPPEDFARLAASVGWSPSRHA